jgi:hypothetical protein
MSGERSPAASERMVAGIGVYPAVTKAALIYDESQIKAERSG